MKGERGRRPTAARWPATGLRSAGIALAALLAWLAGDAVIHSTSLTASEAGDPSTAEGIPIGVAPLECDLSGYTASSELSARMVDGRLAVEWDGANEERLRLQLDVQAGTPTIEDLSISEGGGTWVSIGSDLGLEFKIVEGFRRISNQQLVPLRELGVELTQEVVDRYKWDVFWDAPLDLRTGNVQNNPPPVEGVASQPGLPRSPDEIRRADVRYASTGCRVSTEGRRIAVGFDGIELGSFSGELVLTVFEGTNLIRAEVIGVTDLPSVAYKYDVGLTGLPVSERSRVHWRDVASQRQAYGLRGPANADAVTLRAANRLVVAETGDAAIAAFPPPHTFFWAREVEINVGWNWYRKDDDQSFSIGIRQGEQEVVERYLANWSLYSAPPGSEQRMAAFFYPTLGGAEQAFASALAFTNGDVYRKLPGYRVMGSHYHTDVGRTLQATGSVDSRLSDFEVLRSAGIEIAGPVDRPRDPTQLEEQRWLFEGARRHSDDEFVVMPQMENTNLLGGHWDLLFSHPVHYVDERPAGTPLITDHPEYGRTYNIGSVDDMRTMIEAENMLVFMPHPRTKGSTGYPDAIKETPQFLSDWYRGVGWRWGMGSDLSEKRLSDYRVIPLLDDMNNWISGTDLQLKYLLAITETYFKSPGDDVYANGPVSYLRMDALPEPGDYSPIIDALRSGDYFVSSGEVLVPSVAYSGSGTRMSATAEVEWTFPLDFVEIVTGDGDETRTTTVSAKDLPPFGRHTFSIPFDGNGQAWVRFAAWDAAGNGAMTMPVRLR
ncbi:MAG: hypothetical protein OEN56_14455 [Gemmatimonadota bacterium]|nr:hypothetical protein [Gemmatimonadota bacterium]